nr:PREDICTED: high affinity cationic amino acid transporter 1-like [Bemisia tabaci]
MFPPNVKVLLTKFASVVTRLKSEDSVDLESNKPKLARVLTVLDLTALGIGSTLGVGSYVLPGEVARNTAGPAVTVSFFIAAVVSILAALCYAEFAARVPKAGSAYVYSYMTVGEFCAFVIGWNLILEYVIGTASVAKALSGYLDALTGKVFETYMLQHYPMNVSFLGPYPDLISFSVIMLLSFVLAWGVKESTMLNNIFTALNLTTVGIIIIAGITVAKPSNWFIAKEDLPVDPNSKYNPGEGGFMPFGWTGVLVGAATCFYSFIGFDCIATTGEEAKNPQKTIPLAIVLSLLIIFCVYFGISAVLTMMWPYYDQDPAAPFPSVFEKVGMPQVKWIVSVGAVFALCTSLLGSMFPMARILYAMAEDGLIYTFLAQINKKTLTPLFATFVSGVLAGIISAIFNLTQLIDMMSIGTLLAYSIVSLCILLLRYRKYEISEETKPGRNEPAVNHEEPKKEYPGFISGLLNLENERRATDFSEAISKILIGTFCILCFMHVGGLILMERRMRFEINFWFKAYLIGVGILLVISVILLWRQPQANTEKLTFTAPLMPIVPTLSIYVNTYLMSKLDKATWIRFVVWLLLGLLVYMCYGLRHSKEGKNRFIAAEKKEKISKS